MLILSAGQQDEAEDDDIDNEQYGFIGTASLTTRTSR